MNTQENSIPMHNFNSIILVLFATSATQGQRPNDFCWTQEGELVTFTSACDGEEVDGICGCRRSMAGLRSMRGTTTVQVAYLRGGKQALEQELRTYLKRTAWGERLDDEQITLLVEEDAEELVRIASNFPVRTVLEIRGELFQVRPPHSDTI